MARAHLNSACNEPDCMYFYGICKFCIHQPGWGACVAACKAPFLIIDFRFCFL